MSNKIIESTLESLPPLERSEFDKRMYTVMNSLKTRNILNKSWNKFNEEYEKNKKKTDKIHPLIISIFFVICAILFFISTNEISSWSLVIILCMTIFYFRVSQQINDSTYALLGMNYSFQVEEYTSKINQYAFLHKSDEDFLYECDDASELSKDGNLERKSALNLKLQFEILKRMHLEIRN